MSKVFRIFVEKKKGNDIEAGQTLADLRDNVGLSALEDLRIINRYYAQGLTEEEFNLAVKQILSEPNLDNVYTELSIPEDYRYFAMEYLPGQYDQRADSAAQCIQLLTAGERPEVQSAKIIAVKGDITDEEFEKIKNYIINPVESRVASLEMPESLNIKSDVPADIARIDGFIDMSDDEIEAYHSSMGFAMSIADLCWVRDYFKNDENRNPSLTELKVIDTYWSDHCRHTTFATQLDEIKIDSGKYTDAINKALEQYFDIRKEVYGDRDKIVCLMDMACIGTKVLKKRGLVNNLDESEEINACSIEVPVVIDGKTEQWLVQFKKEKRTTTRLKLSLSVVRLPASAVQSVTHFQAEHTYIRLCVLQVRATLLLLLKKHLMLNYLKADYNGCSCRIFKLRQPNRSCHRSGYRAL